MCDGHSVLLSSTKITWIKVGCLSGKCFEGENKTANKQINNQSLKVRIEFNERYINDEAI